MSKIHFTSSGHKLAGNVFYPQGEPKKLAFLFIQGWTGHQNIAAAQALAKLGHFTMTYDMRGNGESEGNIADFSRADFIRDATVAYDYLKQQAGADVRIGVIGSSFGSYTAVLLSEKRNIFCLSLRVPANYPDEGFNEPQQTQYSGSNDFHEWRKRKLAYNENHALIALHSFEGQVQIIEAGNDERVNSQVPKNYADAITDKTKLAYEVMQNAPHRLATPELQADYEKRLTAWVSKL